MRSIPRVAPPSPLAGEGWGEGMWLRVAPRLETEPTDHGSRYDPSMRWLLFVLVIAGLAFGGWHLTRTQPLAVLLHTVARGDVRATVSNTRVGTVKACSRAKMSPSAPGQVAVLPVHEGDAVVAGQIPSVNKLCSRSGARA